MALSQERMKQIQDLAKQNANSSSSTMSSTSQTNTPINKDIQTQGSLSQDRIAQIQELAKQNTVKTPEQKQSAGPLDFLVDTAKGTVETAKTGLKLAKDAQIASFKQEQDPLSTGIQTVGGIATTALAPVAGAFSAFIEQIPDSFKEKVSKKAGKAFQDIATAYSQKYEKLKEEDPEFADKLKGVVSSPVTKRNVSGLLGIMDLLDVGLARKAVKPATDIGETAIKQFQANRAPKLAEKAIKKATRTYKKHSPDTKPVIKARQAYEKKYGVSVDEDLAKNQVVLETDATGKFYNTKGQAEIIREDAIQSILPVMSEQIETYKDNIAGNVQKLLNSVEDRIRQSKDITAKDRQSIRKIITEEINANASEGNILQDGFINVGTADDIKKGAWGKAYTKTIGDLEGETVTKRAYRILGQELNKMIDEAVDDPLYKAVNREWGRMQSLAEYLEKINETKIKGGRLGKDLDRLIATVAFSNAGAVPAFVGGEAFSLLKQYINNPERVTAEVVSKLRKQGILPDYVLTLQQAKDYLLKVKQAREQTLKLPTSGQTTPAVIIPPAPTVIEPPAKKIRMAEPKEQLLLQEGKDIQLPSAERQALKRSREKIGTPDEAFGAIAGVEQDEEGNITYNPVKGALGAVGLGVAKKSGALKKATQMTDDLIKEAKKYKSADEFVKAQSIQGNSTFTAGFAGTSIFEKYPSVYTKSNKVRGKGLMTADDFFDNNYSLVNAQWAKASNFENAEGFRLKPKIFEKGEDKVAFIAKEFDKLGKIEKYNLKDYKITSDGGKTFFTVEPEVLGTGKTKQQLTEIWNKANRKLVPRSKKD